MPQDKKFLIVRFAPGSGGKFLSTLLQCSDSVNTWEPELEQAKQKKDYDLIFQYITSKFTNDYVNWLKIEPEIPYQTDFVSNRFPRGDNITFEQAQSLLTNDLKFQQDFNNNKLIVLILNKSQIPAWLRYRSRVVNIVIDNRVSKKWFYRARYNKQFIKVDNSTYIIKQEHKDFCSEKRATLAAKFNNESVFRGTWHGFAKKYIIGDTVGKTFMNRQLITEHQTNSTVENLFFDLSSVDNKDQFVEQFNNVCQELGIDLVPIELITKSILYYQTLHQHSR